MKKEQLIEKASALPGFSPSAAEEYSLQQSALADSVTDTLLARSDLDSLIGIGNRQVMKDNHRNHGRFIASMLSSFDPGLLVETILWVFRAYRSRGFEAKYWPVQLEAWLEAIKANLSTESDRKRTRLNSSHGKVDRMPASA